MPDALVDFHLHTTCSDGAWTPDRLFDEIRSRDLEYFCVSDHDNMDAYPVPEDLKSRCVAGLEIDSHRSGQTVHVLAYGMNQRNGALMDRLRQQRVNRSTRAQSIIERLNRLGVDLTFEQVQRSAKTSKSIGRPHIARALVEANYCESLQAAFDEYLAEGCSAYVPLDRLSVLEAIDLIHESEGLAVLAHPRRIRDQSGLTDLLKLFDGIEVVHPTADSDYEQQMFAVVDSNKMIATAGTDFHARPGETNIGVRFPSARVNKLLQRLGFA